MNGTPGQPLHVLIVDDDEDAYVLVRDYLEEIAPEGYAVNWARDYAAGLREMGPDAPYDAYLIDMRLGAELGTELIAAARAKGVRRPMIVLTGGSDFQVAIEAMKAGAVDYLDKGNLTPGGLERAIRYALARHRMEAELQHERTLSAAILDTVDALVVTFDPAGRIVQFNTACEQLTGIRAEEIAGTIAWDRLLLPKEATAVRQVFAELVATGEAGEFRNHWRGVRGPRLIDWRNTVLANEHGDVEYVIGTGVDVTERERDQRALNQAAKMAAIGELVGNIAHEVNNPVGIISAKVRLLLGRRRTEFSDHTALELAKIVEQCERITKLTRGLLDFSRPAQGEGERERLEIVQPVRSALQLVRDRCERFRIEVEFEPPSAPIWVEANENELQQVVLNLLLNAIDAMPQGGHLRVDCDTDAAGYAVVEVGDTGDGIAPDVLDRLFEPFFTTKESGHGTGLGLSICLGLVRSHGGTIDTESVPGHGATFRVRLPQIPPATETVP